MLLNGTGTFASFITEVPSLAFLKEVITVIRIAADLLNDIVSVHHCYFVKNIFFRQFNFGDRFE